MISLVAQKKKINFLLLLLFTAAAAGWVCVRHLLFSTGCTTNVTAAIFYGNILYFLQYMLEKKVLYFLFLYFLCTLYKTCNFNSGFKLFEFSSHKCTLCNKVYWISSWRWDLLEVDPVLQPGSGRLQTCSSHHGWESFSFFSLLLAALWLILFLQPRSYEGRPQLCLQARGAEVGVRCGGGGGGRRDTNRKHPDHKLSASGPTQP